MENTLLNLVPASYLPEVHLSQYDIGRTITFTLKDGASDYSVPSGASITVKATKPSGLGFEVACTFNGGTVTLVTTETMTPENGRFPAELSIVSGNTVIGTSNFIFNIERSPHPEGTIDGDAESLLPELTLLVERIEAAADSVDEDTQIVTDAKAEVLQAKADTLQAKADTLTARDDALQAKADAIAAKESAEASAQAAAESAQEAEDTLSEYAKVDGYYEEMAVGSAEQLLSTQFVEDSVPYKFRTSGGSKDIGNREYDEIVGGSIVWNQLQRNTVSKSGSGITFTYTDGALRVNGTSTSILYWLSSGGWDFYANHIYFVDVGNESYVGDNAKWLWYLPDRFGPAGSLVEPRKILKATSSGASYLQFLIKSGQTIDMTFKPQVFDLTQMFGSQVADHIYSLETAQSGKGVAFFKSLFPNDYYPYNAGELMSVEGLQSHDTVGFNQFNVDGLNIIAGNFLGTNPSANVHTEEYMKVLPNTAYNFHQEFTSDGRYIRFYDADKNLLESNSISNYSSLDFVFTTPANSQYMRVAWYKSSGIIPDTIKNGNVCINLSWSGWRNGEYEPYKKHSYPLDSSLTLRGIPKLNAQNELYFDGDTYSHDGKVQRKYGIVDLGTLNWGDADFAGSPVFRTADLQGIAKDYGDGVCTKLFITKTYATVRDVNGVMRINDGYWSSSSPYTVVHDETYVDATAFKTAMSGVYLIYELATPTEETAEPYTSPQAVDDFGTEEYISGNLVPVGHNTKYPANLRDKLQHLPNMADSDGYYMISQQNKQMSLELFRIPKAPTTDGTYTLKATVSGGTPTYTWEAVE